jgi:hypothetical protein
MVLIGGQAVSKNQQVVADKRVKWKFLEPVLGQPITNGNITRLFNTGDSRPPASFSSLVNRSDARALSAAIYGREGVANCVDASQARRDGAGVLGLDFAFTRHEGRQSSQMWDLLRLEDLSQRLERDGVDRDELGLGPEDCLTGGRGASFSTLTVIERCGGGMPGALDDVDSVLARALMNVGEAQVSAGAAGSYGYGKAAVAQASRIRTVLAYTCFRAGQGESVTRRFVGLTYWGMHRTAGQPYTGWALLGNVGDNGLVAALTDAAADDMAESLGMPRRTSEVDEDLGTTFLIVDPAFGADHLLGAIELFWWPLLRKSREVRLDVTIRAADGSSRSPDVGPDHPLLGQFVEAFDAAEEARPTRAEALGDKHVVHVGTAGITSLLVREAGSSVTQSLVAQMRSPLMVVGYVNTPAANPPLVGVFVSHDETNEHLRRVEPPEHDKWQQQNVGGLNATPADIAISRQVRIERDEAVRALRAPEPDPIYGISAFSRHFPSVDVKGTGSTAGGRSGQKRKVKQRLVRVHLVHQVGDALVEVDRPTRLSVDDGLLRAEAEVKFFLDPDRAARVNKRTLDATITVGAQIAEDGSAAEWWPAAVTQKIRGTEPDFELASESGQSPAKYRGQFTVGEPVHFFISTEPYRSDWTLNMVFDCSPWDVLTPSDPNPVEESGDTDGV